MCRVFWSSGKSPRAARRDSWGSHAEYSADIDYISLDQDWEAGDHAPEDSFYLWGPELPADFVRNFEADPAD